MWDCALGPGAWLRRHEDPDASAAAMLSALEVTAGLALVRPAHHTALSGRGFAIRGAESRMALRVTWDDRGTTRFEWTGAADATVTLAPRRRVWDVVLFAAGVAVWRSADATALSSTDALAAAVGAEVRGTPYTSMLHNQRRREVFRGGPKDTDKG